MSEKRVNHTRYIGIDPGKNGWICVIDVDCIVPLQFHAMPATDSLLATLFIELGITEARCEVVIERVWSRPGEGVASSFRFGREFGRLLAMVWGINRCVEYFQEKQLDADVFISCPTPQKWQEWFGLSSKANETYAARKVRNDKYAVSILHPWEIETGIPKGAGDAYLLARYAEGCRLRPVDEVELWSTPGERKAKKKKQSAQRKRAKLKLKKAATNKKKAKKKAKTKAKPKATKKGIGRVK